MNQPMPALAPVLFALVGLIALLFAFGRMFALVLAHVETLTAALGA